MTSILFASSSVTPLPHSINTTKIILVRHARTTYNQQSRYQGSSDESVLTKQGHKDAYATGLALQQYNFAAVYTSPLTRVQQTTNKIVSAIDTPNLPVYVEPRLTEVCMSDWQGLFYDRVKQEYPEDYHCWQTTPHLFTRNQVNYPVLELFERAKSFWQTLLKKHRGQTILIVAHGGTNRALISSAIALAPKHYHTLQQCNCGISCLEFPARSNLARLEFLNDTKHLSKNLPKLKAGKTGWRWLLLAHNTIADTSHPYLSKLLAENLINLVLTEDSSKSQELADRPIAKSNTLQILINGDVFLHNWHQAIASKKHPKVSLQTTKLFTGLIIAPEKLIAQILHQTIDAESYLNLSANLAVVHYPEGETQSILQGMLPLGSGLAQPDLPPPTSSSEVRAIAS